MINCIKCGALHEGDTCPKCIDKELRELRARVKDLKQGGWISIDAMLPERYKAVLIWCPDNKCTYNATYNYEESDWEYFGGGGGKVCQKPTHWQPLPAPPMEKE